MRSCKTRVNRWVCVAPLTGKELYLKGLNSGTTESHAALAKAGKIGRQGCESRKAREARDPDHGRDQDQAIRPRDRWVSERIERVDQRERAAIGEADDMQRRGRIGPPPRLAHCKPRRRNPLIPFHVGQRRRHRAVRWHSRHNRNEATIPIEVRDVALAIGRVCQAMQQHRCADWLAVRLQHEGAIEVLRKTSRIDRAAIEIAVDRNAIVRRQLLGDLAAQLVEDRGFVREILLPVGGVELCGA